MRFVTTQDQVARGESLLGEDAVKFGASRGRALPTSPDRFRNEFQRDRDKILHTKAFRRLSHKTQVFLAPVGDHYRTRLTHTLEVAQIARTIARALALNEDLTEAIALGHDLGHTPFGHVGEEAISESIARHKGIAPDSPKVQALYRHNEQSLRVVDVIENSGKGLNLTWEVRNGILCHTGSVRAATLEGRIVATADRIAYVNHDIDDAIRAGSLSESQLPESTHRVLGCCHADRIETLVEDMVEESVRRGDIAMSAEVWDAMMELRSFLFDYVYTSEPIMHEVHKAKRLVASLFDYFVSHYEDVPPEYRAIAGEDRLRGVTDHVAGMTDRYAQNLFKELFVPHSWNL